MSRCISPLAPQLMIYKTVEEETATFYYIRCSEREAEETLNYKESNEEHVLQAAAG